MEDTTSRSGEEDDLDEAAQSSVSLPSSSRQQRNQAEKKRRDTLNNFITELGSLVPMVSASPKKLDKTSVLRLAAAYLRVHQTLAKTKEEYHRLSIPIKWCQLILDGMDGMLLVITASGKVVFISHNIEALLGHSQTDLLGQSLYNITSLEDHEELKANLTPSPSPAEDLDRPSTSASTSSAGSSDSTWKRDLERRSFYLRLRHKSTPRGEQPQYEVVHIVGHLRVPSPPPTKKRSPGGGSSSEGAQHLNQEVVLVAMMKPFKEIRITSSSFLEASREEWISRHLIDGTIVYSDHRISVVSGYMAEEVTGDFAFRYMHEDDVRWVLIALRQMYFRGESYGKSCYRLMSKTGEYIYIRTHGYLELNEDTHSVQSFVCINTLVPKDEGEQHIKEMKELYTPMVACHDSSVITFTNSTPTEDSSSNMLSPLNVGDPGELGKAIQQLLSDLPLGQIHPRDSDNPVSDEQYAKCAMVSKTTLPKLQVHCNQVGVMNVPLIKKGPRYQSRPSVITRAKEKRSSVEDQSTSKKIRQETPPNPSAASALDINRSVIKSRDDYMEMECSDDSSMVPLSRYASSPQGSFAISSPPSGYTLATGSSSQIDYLSSPGDVGGSLILESATSPTTSSARQPSELFLNEFITVDSLDTRLGPSLTDAIEDPLQVGPLDTLGFWTSEMDSLDEGVVRGHMQLEERIQFQDTQISAIEEDLTLVPISSEGNNIYRSTVTHLKAEHRKQQQMLKTLKQDHQSIQQCSKDQQLAVRGAQDIGALSAE
uniref:Aryl hydrocarbon receptor nuclear translocator-like protein 1 n=2 Tax=Lygus hesperus TaxID=30085 RepID=A0A146LNU6_LYGHE